METLNLWIAIGLLALGVLGGFTLADFCWRGEVKRLNDAMSRMRRLNAFLETTE